jgi:hypothetical protein
VGKNAEGQRIYGNVCNLEDNIKRDLKEKGQKNVDWIHVFYDWIHWGWYSCEYVNAPFGFIQGGEFIFYLNDRRLLKKDSAPWS